MTRAATVPLGELCLLELLELNGVRSETGFSLVSCPAGWLFITGFGSVPFASKPSNLIKDFCLFSKTGPFPFPELCLPWQSLTVSSFSPCSDILSITGGEFPVGVLPDLGLLIGQSSILTHTSSVLETAGAIWNTVFVSSALGDSARILEEPMLDVSRISLSFIFRQVPFADGGQSVLDLCPGKEYGGCLSSSLLAFSLDSEEADKIEDELPVLLQVLTRGRDDECLLCSRFHVPDRVIGSLDGDSECDRPIS